MGWPGMCSKGFGLIEVTALIIIVGVLAAVVMQSMTAVVEDARRVKTEREMEMLAGAIIGNPDLTSGGMRSDFGYVADIGAFPPNLDALHDNPGGYATWDGPYLPPGYAQDSTGFKADEWGKPYTYGGGVTVTSTGSGLTITKKLADATSDYLLNQLSGTIKDANDSLPGATYKDSVDIEVTIPDGSGGTVTKAYSPDSVGAFTLDSLPTGQHPLRVIFAPEVDTLYRYVTILPRHKSSREYKFASAHFTPGDGCDSSGSMTLRPNGVGTTTELSSSGCGANWQCVDEESSDGNATRVRSQGASYRTDTYAMADPAASSCHIAKVTVYCRAKKITIFLPGYVKLVLRTGGTDYESSAIAVNSNYANRSHEWVTNPNTGSEWTWSEIDALECGVSLQTFSPIFRVECTQVWMEVEYGP